MFPPIPTNLSYINSNVRAGLFGKFDYKVLPNGSDITIEGDWVKENIVLEQVPELIGVPGGGKYGHVTCHKLAVVPMKLLFAELKSKGLLPKIVEWDGMFCPRLIRGSTNLSNHAFGTAFDINALYNKLGLAPAAEGKAGCLYDIVPIANKYGFWWGGHYKGRKDGMHFELVKLIDFPK